MNPNARETVVLLQKFWGIGSWMDTSGDERWTPDQGSLPVTVDQSSRPPLLVCKYRHGLYLYLYSCIDPVDLHYDSGIG